MSVIELPYQLAELPSAQHRAGLAGLVLMVQELTEYQRDRFEYRFQQGAIVELKDMTDFGVTLCLNQQGLQALFDLTHAAFVEERSTETKIKNPKDVREVEVTKEGKTKVIKRYYYDVVVPEGAFLPVWDTSSDNPKDKRWVRLWREMVWNILRGVPTTRTSYNSRSNGASYTQDVEQVWAALSNPEKTTGQTGQYYLGATATNPENVPAKDKILYQFLLHFWAFVAQVYCPMTLDKDGRREAAGYAIAIPDVAALQKFCRVFPDVLKRRSPDPYGYRPREAIIDLPEEGALDLLLLLQKCMAHVTGDQQIRRLILGIELIHAERAGNSGIKIRSVSQVDPIKEQIDRYEDIRKAYWCPWFRKQRLLNLVRSQPESDESDAPLKELPPWYEFDALLSRIPRNWLEAPLFSHDARELLINEAKLNMKSAIRSYAQIVYQVCQRYVIGKLDSKYALKWDDCKGNPKKEEQYNDKKYKIANEAFLAVRSRTENQAFIDYFVSTLYPFVKKEEFADFAVTLFNQTDEIRALTLLALSSQFPISKKSETGSNDADAA